MGQIPKVIHYLYGLSPDFGGKPWGLAHHVCAMSALERIRPDGILFHCEHEPEGPWWELTRRHVSVQSLKAPTEVLGRPLQSVAHRADVLRLETLIDRGGIYLDADVFVHRDFDALLDHACVLGQEGPDAQFGLANAVILAKPRSLFLTRWLDQYHWFRGGPDRAAPFWNEHSVQLPHFMSKLFPNEVTVLNCLAFFWPLWVEPHLDWIFASDAPIDLTHSYATHLWESAAWRHLGGLTPGRLRATRSNFARWAAPYLADLPDDYGL